MYYYKMKNGDMFKTTFYESDIGQNPECVLRCHAHPLIAEGQMVELDKWGDHIATMVVPESDRMQLMLAAEYVPNEEGEDRIWANDEIIDLDDDYPWNYR
jgi:hypothetical protein